MKTKFLSALSLFFAGHVALTAAPLTATTAVHTKPDLGSPAISYLKAGTEPIPVLAGIASTPAGWMAVEVAGPFKIYVENKDLAKSLDPKPGVPLRLAPKPDAGILALAEQSDKTALTGVRGKWTEFTLEKNLTGYIRVGGTAGYLPPIATAPAGGATRSATSSPAPAPLAASPVSPGIYGVATQGQAAAMVNLGDGGSATLPRQFAGKFVSTRRAFTPRRPYDYALNDDAGKRYAYLDISKLLLTEQIENYIGHSVVVYGVAKAGGAEGKDMVIAIETLQLK